MLNKIFGEIGNFLLGETPIVRLIPLKSDSRAQLSLRGLGWPLSICISRTIFKYLGMEEGFKPLTSAK
jgi:hypothetical protein